MKKLTIIIFSILTISVFGQADYTYYTKAEVEQDLNFAFERLISIHPIFIDKTELIHFQNKLLEIEKSIKDSMTQNEVYLLLAPVFASLNDGHTGVIVPTDQRLEYTKAGGKSFPFFVDIVNDSIYVSFYCGNNTSPFQSGEQILEINGISASEMVHNMESLLSGEIPAIKQKEIANKFRFLIWILYGFEDNYELVIKKNRHEIQRTTIPGVSSAEFMQNIKRMPKTNQNYYALDINQSKESAIMIIKSFGDLEGFCAFADSAFTKIKENEIKNLVIDIRDNGGGRSIVVDSLMNYLTDKTYSQYRKIEIRISAELKKHYEDRYPDRLDWINSYTIDDLVVPERNLEKTQEKGTRFNGNLFLLTNKATFSAAATFAGIFKELSLGTIIGEETGGTISYFGDFWFMKTPNAGIMFHVSPKRFIQYGGTEYDRGVIPDYKIADKRDSIIIYTYDLIKRQLK
jgi:Peptidase family S41